MNLREKCPLCSGSSIENFMECKDFTVSNETFKIVSCQSCGLHYTLNPPTEEKIGDYYKSEEYISHSSTQKGVINKMYQVVRNKALKKKVKLVQQYFQDEKTLLDIGAGTGHFVDACLQNNIKAIGLEPDEDARKNAKEIHNIDLKDLSAINHYNEIEVITMWHVLEHVYQLRDFIEDLQKRIKRNGVWIVAVPNMSSHDAKHYQNFWAAYDVPRHLYHFQPEQMKFIADEFGFTLEKIKPMKYDAYYVSMLSEKYKGGNILKAAFRGLKSNSKADNESYSSQIYIFRKK